MTSADIRAALRKRWPDTEYLTIDEAPDSPDRMGRKVDFLAVSLWRSRGYEIDAVEIKVSHSDWMREVNEAAKADFWWRHSHRFWVAVPVSIALKVRETLPSTWGLLAVSSGGVKPVVKALKHDAQELTWQQSIGLMRASANAGIGAIQRAEFRGYDRGYERAKAEVEAQSGDGAAREQLIGLRAKVEAFRAASGIDLVHCYSERKAAEIGVLYRFMEKSLLHPDRMTDQLFRVAQTLDGMARNLREVGGEIQKATHNGAESA